ncbi:uncharacterized protein BDZ99DRAFT_523131 [Mytilinidion resinicola]|uniref:Uncharacterized protein n=1 Tax=Mytilinidion resinicola TaxID=574789 RepID=A0A6A6YFK6_9PEZI|nr:uncharacterized protein BDZ99DRAFT_523131 [Mytilinidion resinicola]KAF2807520.1 hypothetical protein BDZ99DRAFT_523131 [Mytilinidion resinicola]
MFNHVSERLYSGHRSWKIDIERPKDLCWLKGQGPVLSRMPSMQIILAIQPPPRQQLSRQPRNKIKKKAVPQLRKDAQTWKSATIRSEKHHEVAFRPTSRHYESLNKHLQLAFPHYLNDPSVRATIESLKSLCDTKPFADRYYYGNGSWVVSKIDQDRLHFKRSDECQFSIGQVQLVRAPFPPGPPLVQHRLKHFLRTIREVQVEAGNAEDDLELLNKPVIYGVMYAEYACSLRISGRYAKMRSKER